MKFVLFWLEYAVSIGFKKKFLLVNKLSSL